MLNRLIDLYIDGVLYPGGGGDDRLNISFYISKTMLGSPNQAEITVIGLGKDKIDRLQTRGLPVEMLIGHEDDEELVRVFKGDLYTAIPSRSGTDIVTSLNCLDGGEAITYVKKQKTYDQVPVATAVEELAEDLVAEIVDGTIGVIDVKGDFGYKGRAISGPANLELDRLAREYNFSWSVSDGVFNAIDDESYLPETWEVSSRAALQSAKQIVSGPLQVQTGVEIQALINPRILPQHLVNLIWEEKNDFVESLAGIYKVHNLTMNGETRGPAWSMGIQCFTVGGIGIAL